MEDNYGRKKNGYESLHKSIRLTKNDITFNTPSLKKSNNYLLNNIKIEISYFSNFKKFNSFDDKSVSIILDGNIINDKSKTVITIGEIVKSYTLKKLSNFFKINKKILILKASKN